MTTPQTLQEAITYFADSERAFEYAIRLRWPDGKVICPRCGSGENWFIKTRRLWFCKGCERQFTIKVGTIFEDSALGLDKWMTAVWMIVNCRNGISSHELSRSLGITQKSAWFVLHRVREALKAGGFGRITKLGGGPGSEVEADESWIGGRTKNMHRSRRLRCVRTGEPYWGKAVVHGLLDRKLRKVRATVVPDVTRETLQNAVLKNVKYGSSVYTDSAVSYDKLHVRFVHDVVNHAERYVKGRVHTNGLENFWSLLKRNLRGTYVSVEPFHLSRYLDEQVFRFNSRLDGERKITDAERFATAMHQVVGKRLTYEELTGKGTDSLYTPETGTREAQPF